MTIGPIQLIRQATPGQRRTLLAAALGWALHAFDAMLYALVRTLLMRDLGMSETTAGSLPRLFDGLDHYRVLRDAATGALHNHDGGEHEDDSQSLNRAQHLP
jgi:hypothetical protein